MTNSQWEQANKQVDEIMVISENKTSNEWFRLVDEYYLTGSLSLRTALVTKIETDSIALIAMVETRKEAAHNAEVAAAEAASIAAAAS
jgi:hypothetical protein